MQLSCISIFSGPLSFPLSMLLRISRTCRALRRASINRHLGATATTKPYLSDATTTHFGFSDVPIEQKESKVRHVFENVADSYDVMNDFMSAGLHRVWKDYFTSLLQMEKMAQQARQMDASLSILDVAGGTGDISFRFLEQAGCIERAKSSGIDQVQITVCDINAEMLRVGESRAKERFGTAVTESSQALRFVQGNAQDLKDFPDNTFDVYTIAFGLRNVTDVDLALREARRVLKPGGRYLCLEFSHLPSPLMQQAYDMYSFNIIPVLGQVVANDRASYQYLVESIRKFSNQTELQQRMEQAGMEQVSYENLSGGIVAIHQGWKGL